MLTNLLMACTRLLVGWEYLFLMEVKDSIASIVVVVDPRHFSVFAAAPFARHVQIFAVPSIACVRAAAAACSSHPLLPPAPLLASRTTPSSPSCARLPADGFTLPFAQACDHARALVLPPARAPTAPPSLLLHPGSGQSFGSAAFHRP